jgi:hypothetical protein
MQFAMLPATRQLDDTAEAVAPIFTDQSIGASISIEEIILMVLREDYLSTLDSMASYAEKIRQINTSEAVSAPAGLVNQNPFTGVLNALVSQEAGMSHIESEPPGELDMRMQDGLSDLQNSTYQHENVLDRVDNRTSAGDQTDVGTVMTLVVNAASTLQNVGAAAFDRDLGPSSPGPGDSALSWAPWGDNDPFP